MHSCNRNTYKGRWQRRPGHSPRGVDIVGIDPASVVVVSWSFTQSLRRDLAAIRRTPSRQAPGAAGATPPTAAAATTAVAMLVAVLFAYGSRSK